MQQLADGAEIEQGEAGLIQIFQTLRVEQIG